MSAYLIKYIDDLISIFEYEDTKLSILKNKGEESWKYQDSSFWNWFKEKIEYEDEELSFIVLCDKEFNIDNSITLMDKHFLTQEQIEDILFEEDLKVFDILLFPNQYKAIDIIRSIQKKKDNTQKLRENEIKKNKQIDSLNQKTTTLQSSLIQEQNKQSDILAQREQLLNRLKSFKNTYINSSIDVMKSFETQVLPGEVRKIVTQTMKFALAYADSGNVKSSTVQASDVNNYITIEEETRDEYKSVVGIPVRVFGVNSISATPKPSKKIEIKLDSFIRIELKEDIKADNIHKETKKFFEHEFSKLTVEYAKLQKKMVKLGVDYVEKISKSTKVDLNNSIEKLGNKQIFTDNVLFTNDIVIIEDKNYNEPRNDIKEIEVPGFGLLGFSGNGFNTQSISVNKPTMTIYPDKIIQLIKTNTDKMSDSIIEIQKNILTSIVQSMPSDKELFKNELSQQNIKIAKIEKEMMLVTEQINKLMQPTE